VQRQRSAHVDSLERLPSGVASLTRTGDLLGATIARLPASLSSTPVFDISRSGKNFAAGLTDLLETMDAALPDGAST